jgi:hypothetical protein
VREIDRGLAGALQRSKDMKKERVVAVLCRWDAVPEPFELIILGIEAGAL